MPGLETKIMSNINQVRGMLLEEALLYLLRHSGYRTVESTNDDPTLFNGRAGINVRGRGGGHQIDAIADFVVQQPFSHPQRLLVEAKCTRKSTELPVIRNAVGTLKDICEYFVPESNGKPASRRYHYQYALFSAKGYTKDAERYAYAQDIYLITLANSNYFQGVIDAIYAITEEALESQGGNLDMSSLRRELRRWLLEPYEDSQDSDFWNGYSPAFREQNANIVQNVKEIRYALLATFTGGIPAFLIPAPGFSIETLNGPVSVKIRYDLEDTKSWYLYRNEEIIFSFDLPKEFFNLYAKDGRLSNRQAINLKRDQMHTIRAIWTEENDVDPKIITFRLDYEWLNEVQRSLSQES